MSANYTHATGNWAEMVARKFEPKDVRNQPKEGFESANCKRGKHIHCYTLSCSCECHKRGR